MKPAINLPSEPENKPQLSSIDGGLRNTWQWLAMGTMVLDHIGFLYYQVEWFRYAGRLAMPLYAMLFVITLRSGHCNHKRLGVIALLSQIPYSCLFGYASIRGLDLNIIFGFYIFYWLTMTIKNRNVAGLVVVAAAMCLPNSYGWYLYASLAAFYWLNSNPAVQRGAFAGATVLYTVLAGIHPRQLLAITVPFIQGIRTVRPNKYLYRYFYPGHLLILLVIDFMIMGTVVTPFGTYPQPEPFNDPQEYYEYDEIYDESYESYGTYETDTGTQQPNETVDYGHD